MFDVIVRDNGIDRLFGGLSNWDAIYLFDALSRHAPRVEMWQGSQRVRVYDANFETA